MKLFALLLALLLGSCQETPKGKPTPVSEDWERDPKTQRFVERKRIPVLQSQATAACLCKRNGGDEAECWSAFWKDVNGYRHSSAASACGAGSSAYVDFNDASAAGAPAAEMSVITGWGYGACSNEEVAPRKAAYERKSKIGGC